MSPDQVVEFAARLFRRAFRAGGEYADLFVERTVLHRLFLRHSRGTRARLHTPGPEHLEGAGVRVLRNGQTGFAAANGLTPRALLEAAGQIAPAGTEAGPAPDPVPPAAVAQPAPLPIDAPDEISQTEKEALLYTAWDVARGWDERVRGVEVVYQDRVRRVQIVTSEGVTGADATVLIGLRIGVSVEIGGTTHTAYAVGGGACGFGHFLFHTPEMLARQATERAVSRAEAVPMPGGEMPVVIASGWGGIWLHEAIGHLLEADAFLASPLARPGEPIAGEAVTLVDDGTLSGGRGSARLDDEGTPTRRTVLVDRGVLQNVLTDRVHARRLGLPPTGNARRQDYRFAPLPRMTNFFLQPGTADPTDLIAEVKHGLYVREVERGYLDPVSLRFTFHVAAGHRIENGRLTAPVAGLRLVGRTADVLRQIVGVGYDGCLETARGQCEKHGQIVPVSAGQPTVLLARLHVEPA